MAALHISIPNPSHNALHDPPCAASSGAFFAVTGTAVFTGLSGVAVRNHTLPRQSLAESSGRPRPHRRPVGISGGPSMKRPQSTTTESSLP